MPLPDPGAEKEGIHVGWTNWSSQSSFQDRERFMESRARSE